ncbi:alpha/beta-hydrolase [Amylocystis lapponica]|nr:alpha/beta-hydrolase [Amylocystis lapponica]
MLRGIAAQFALLVVISPVVLLLVCAQSEPYAFPPSSWPHVYPGMPTGDYSTEWQSYFQVTESLPNITWDLARSYAGNINVQREGHPNNTLFFWAFEKQDGSLTADSTEPWAIWLNGGPGASSLLGLLYEACFPPSDYYSAYPNNYSWDTVADYIWIDQPVGTGWSTTDETGFVYDEDQMGSDFMGFLENLVKVFPSLKSRPLYLTGESYAGTYIVPIYYQGVLRLIQPPVNLTRIAIGDGTIGSTPTFEYVPTTYTIETYPQLIGYDPNVFAWFKEQEHLCGYDLNLTYPQDGNFPDLQLIWPTAPGRNDSVYLSKRDSTTHSKRSLLRRGRELHSADNGALRRRDLAGRANGTIDPWYGCFTYDAMIDYALNYTYPWNVSGNFDGFDIYDVPDALYPEIPLDGSVFLNDQRTVAALHAPTSNPWIGEQFYPFLGGQDYEDPSVEPMAFLTELAFNATARNLSIVIFSGNDDSLIAHRGSEVVIQNTTFGGIQGFTRQPATPWYNDVGAFAGIVHQERNWTYVLVKGAGHLVAETNPTSGLVLVREFILGSNQTGLVTNRSGTISVLGGENATLAQNILPGQAGIFVGSMATQSTYTFPSETVVAWQKFVATATATATSAGTFAGSAKANAGAVVTPATWLVTVNTAPERASRVVGRVLEALKDRYTIMHVANIDKIEDVQAGVEREKPDLLFTASMWTPEQAQEIVGIAKEVAPELKTLSLPPGLSMNKGQDGVVEYIKQKLPEILDGGSEA